MSKHKPIPKKIRLFLYDKYNHRCGYCGQEIDYKDMQIDHIKSIYKHSDLHKNMTEDELYSLENYMPSCRQCNFYKSTKSVEDFKKTLETTLVDNIFKTFQWKLAEKYHLVENTTHPIVFYYETLNL